MSLPTAQPGSTVLITGSSSGLGAEFARQLAARGHNLTLVARRRDRLEELAGELSSHHGVEVAIHERDLAEDAERVALVADVRAGGKDVDGLVNNAGFGTSGPFAKLDQEREREEVRLNVGTVHALCGDFVPGMVERGTGAILNVASIAANQPIPDMATYSATKAFVQAFSEALHAELSGTGVSCTVLCPGPVATEWETVAGLGRSWMPKQTYTDPADVVRAGVDGMERGTRNVVPGMVPQALAMAGRFTPRAILLPATRISGRLRRRRD